MCAVITTRLIISSINRNMLNIQQSVFYNNIIYNTLSGDDVRTISHKCV